MSPKKKEKKKKQEPPKQEEKKPEPKPEPKKEEPKPAPKVITVQKEEVHIEPAPKVVAKIKCKDDFFFKLFCLFEKIPKMKNIRTFAKNVNFEVSVERIGKIF